MDSLHREFDRMFDSFWRGMEPQSFASSIWGFDGAVPAIDQSEDETAYHIAVELPGIEEKDVEASLADNVLTIHGERKLDKEEKEQNYYLRERAGSPLGHLSWARCRPTCPFRRDLARSR